MLQAEGLYVVRLEDLSELLKERTKFGDDFILSIWIILRWVLDEPWPLDVVNEWQINDNAKLDVLVLEKFVRGSQLLGPMVGYSMGCVPLHGLLHCAVGPQ